MDCRESDMEKLVGMEMDFDVVFCSHKGVCYSNSYTIDYIAVKDSQNMPLIIGLVSIILIMFVVLLVFAFVKIYEVILL